jgi:hypothetical protein
MTTAEMSIRAIEQRCDHDHRPVAATTRAA